MSKGPLVNLTTSQWSRLPDHMGNFCQYSFFLCFINFLKTVDSFLYSAWGRGTPSAIGLGAVLRTFAHQFFCALGGHKLWRV